MNQIVAYLTFNGNCKEAMHFYQDCLGGDLSLQTLGDSPKSDVMPQAMKECIIQASLKKENMLLMGTDMTEDKLLRGNSISILLECDSDAEMMRYYEKLAEAGKATHPITETFWGTLFGGLTDKYGNHWLFRCKI